MNRKWFVVGGCLILSWAGYVWQQRFVGSIVNASPPATMSASATRPIALHTASKPTSLQISKGVVATKQAGKSKGTEQADILIQGGEVWTANGKIWQPGDVWVRGHKIMAVGPNLKVKGAKVIVAKGYVVTPGLIDTHSHIGVYSSPGVVAHSDGNEATRAVTADVWAEHSFWPQDPAISRAMAGGVTTAQILPGSANLIGGRTLTIKLKPQRSAQEMKFPHAPVGLKMACGENPKRVHRDLATRMGNTARFRQTFQQAKEYQQRWERYHIEYQRWLQKKQQADKCRTQSIADTNKKTKHTLVTKRPVLPTSRPVRSWALTKRLAKSSEKLTCPPFELLPPVAPVRNLGMETLVAAFAGKILVHIHCYRADDMLKMMHVAQEFSLPIRAFHHAVEAYKIRDVLAKHHIGVAVWADWWGFKLEAFDGIQENAAMSAHAGVRVSIHSDSALGIQRLNHEAAKAFYRGNAMGLNLSYDQAIRWITKNPAYQLGIDRYTGSLEPGKMADLVIWDGHPFRVRTRTHLVMIDGQIVFQRNKPLRKSDFELGLQIDQPGMFATP